MRFEAFAYSLGRWFLSSEQILNPKPIPIFLLRLTLTCMPACPWKKLGQMVTLSMLLTLEFNGKNIVHNLQLRRTSQARILSPKISSQIRDLLHIRFMRTWKNLSYGSIPKMEPHPYLSYPTSFIEKPTTCYLTDSLGIISIV